MLMLLSPSAELEWGPQPRSEPGPGAYTGAEVEVVGPFPSPTGREASCPSGASPPRAACAGSSINPTPLRGLEVNVSKLFIIVKTCLDNRSTIQNPTGCPVFCDITCRHI
ncbi:unnamed protein product [Gadus morhua 'NCC']